MPKLCSRLPSNAKMIYKPAQDEISDDVISPYRSTIVEEKSTFDIIVIDGMERNACARIASRMLADDWINIFDDSHSSKYAAGMDRLAQAGFWRIDFGGSVTDRSVTSIFGVQHSAGSTLNPD